MIGKVQYARETFKYLKKTWWLLGLVCLPAAVALGFFIRPVASLSFLPFYAMTDVKSFSDIMGLVLEPVALKWIWPPFVIYAALFLTFCVTLPLIEKHFRVGRIAFKKPLSLINNYFLPVLKITLIYGAVLVFYFALLVSLTALQHYLITGAGYPKIASVVVASVLAVGMFILLCWLSSPFMFMIPLMQIYGYSFGDAFTSSVSYYGNKPFKVTFGFAFIFFIVAAMRIVFSALATFIPPWAEILISCALHLFLLVYFCAYCMVTTFSLTGMERKDLRKY